MKDLNIGQESIKILEEKTGNNLFDLSPSNFLLDPSLKAREIKEKMNSWDLIKIKSFCTAKETINKTKRQPMQWRRYFKMTYQIKSQYTKSIKNLSNSTPKKQIIQLRNGQKTQTFFQEDIQMANRHMKRCSTTLIIREIQIKTTLRYHLTPVSVAKMNNPGNNRYW